MKTIYKLLFLFILITSCSDNVDDEGNIDCTPTPKLITQEASNVMETSAVFSGQITAPTCESSVTSQGFAYATTTLPKTDDFVIEVNGRDISSEVANLQRNTTYYMRTFFVNPSGEYYGDEVQFKTLAGEVNISTMTVENVTINSAESGGIIENNGGGSILNKGICWGTSPNPTIDDNISQNNSEGDEFNSQITDLLENTTYYVRAYATNERGTSYGNEEVFTTLATKFKVELDITGNIDACGYQANYFYYEMSYRFDETDTVFEVAEGGGSRTITHSKLGEIKNNLEVTILLNNFDIENPSDEFRGAYLDDMSLTITNTASNQEVLNIELPRMFICTDVAYKNIINFNPKDNSYTIEQLIYGF
ncbi:MAG: hypothetical protein COA80_14225 [Leeuwenhoekiella sp.]|nr:MAG: hypothetical protein COA80_14225 [Leeuwenhoekiella sp.]